MPSDPIFSTVTQIQKKLSQKQLILTSHALPPIIPLNYVIATDLELCIDLVSCHSWRPVMTGSYQKIKSFLFATLHPSEMLHQLKLQIKENIKSTTLGPIPLVNSLLVSVNTNYKLIDFQLYDLEINLILC